MLEIHSGVYDPHPERRRRLELERRATAVRTARRLDRWARCSALLSSVLARHAAARRMRPVC